MGKSKYDERISVVKAICIILMVVGHAGCPQILGTWIYQFHMPCFFFASGFLLKDKYLDEIRAFVKRRFIGLWCPFVKWSLLFMFLHNFFAYIHFYDTAYTWSNFVDKTFHILTLTGSEQLLGGFWFLKELLYASIISILSLKIFTLFWGKIRLIEGGILTILFVVLSFCLSMVSFKIPTISSVTMLASAFYIAGYTYSKLSFAQRSFFPVGILGLLIIVIVSFFYQGNMMSKSWYIPTYFFVALVGTIAIVNLSGFIKGITKVILDYLGSKTLYILTFHFVSFKVVSLVKIWQYDLPIHVLSSFPVIDGNNSLYWILYSIVGVVLPVLIWELKGCCQLDSRNAA